MPAIIEKNIIEKSGLNMKYKTEEIMREIVKAR